MNSTPFKIEQIRQARRPAISTYDPRLVRPLKHLFPASRLGDNDFRKMVLRDNFPIPAEDFREGYCQENDIGYWLNGLVSFLDVAGTLAKIDLQPKRILDLGSASGRVTRHFCNQIDGADVWAADINPNHVLWLTTHFPGKIKAVLVDELPGLPIADDTLDFVCAFSVFTHIDQQETDWLAEVRRVLRPGGIAYLTVHNDATWESLGQMVRQSRSNRLLESMRHTQGFSIDQLHNAIPDGKTVYHFAQTGMYRSQVFHSDSYLRRVWSQFLEIIDIQSLAHERQAAVLLRKSQTEPGINE